MLKGKTIVLGITGGIAAYKAADLTSRLVKLGASVFVIMTKNACQFITPLTLSTISGNPVVTDTFERPATWEVEHIALAKRADLFIVAPATANIIGKLANGLADDMLSTTLMATRAKVLLAPAMNTGMWENVAVVKNMDLLIARGFMKVGPDAGLLACGDIGEGRMAEPVEIAKIATDFLTKQQDLHGKKVLVTAGPTREMLDPVRYITNRSSGKMGYAIAEAAKARGAEVTLVTGSVNLTPPCDVNVIDIQSTQDLFDAVVKNVNEYDAIIQAAAPADYRPETVESQKIKKTGDEPYILKMVQNPDIAAELGRRKRQGQVLVAFAAETENLIDNAYGKLIRKNSDLIVANDVTKPFAGFDVDTNLVTIIARDGHATELPLLTKAKVADILLDMVAKLWQSE